MQHILETSKRLVDYVSLDFVRHIYDEIDWSQRLIWIVWQRWVGKTTLMLQYIKQNNNKQSVYFSADNIRILNDWLYYSIEKLYFDENIRHFFVDEIHKYSNWNQELKNLYDSFPEMKLVFTGSSAINLIKWKYDLSRRLTLYKLQWLSLREYINKTQKLNIKKYDLSDLINNTNQVVDDVYGFVWDKIPFLFKQYLRGWYYPFAFENDDLNIYYNKIWWAIDKLIYEDISNSYRLDTFHLEKFKFILMFFAFAAPWELSINSLSKKLSLAHDTTANYLDILSQVWVINSIFSEWLISTTIRKAKKIYIDNPNIVYYLNNEISKQVELWTIRELFFVNQVHYKNKLFYSNIGDFLSTIKWNKVYFEIWWVNKTKKQIKWVKNAYLVKDDTIFASNNEIPLWLFWFLY